MRCILLPQTLLAHTLEALTTIFIFNFNQQMFQQTCPRYRLADIPNGGKSGHPADCTRVFKCYHIANVNRN